jgi:hypothetical protein
MQPEYVDEVAPVGPSIWEAIQALAPRQRAVLLLSAPLHATGRFYDLCRAYGTPPSDIKFREVRQTYRVPAWPLSSPGPPELKREVLERIAARQAARWERKLAKWTSGLLPYES